MTALSRALMTTSTKTTRDAKIRGYHRCLRTLEELRQEIQQASSSDTIMASQGNTHVRAKQLQNVLNGGKLDSDIMGAFCKIMDNGPRRWHCKIFKPGLYDALSTSVAPGRNSKGDKDDAKRYTQGIDIYQYEIILVQFG